MVGKGTKHYLEAQYSWGFGSGRSNTVLEGSPQHLLLKEAKDLVQEAKISPGRKETQERRKMSLKEDRVLSPGGQDQS